MSIGNYVRTIVAVIESVCANNAAEEERACESDMHPTNPPKKRGCLFNNARTLRTMRACMLVCDCRRDAWERITNAKPLFRISLEFPRHTYTQVYAMLYVRLTQHKHWPRLQARPTSMLPMSDSNRVFHFCFLLFVKQEYLCRTTTHTERAHYATACCDRDATQINQSHIYIRGLPRSGLNC